MRTTIIKKLKLLIKAWIKEVFGNKMCDSRFDQLKDDLAEGWLSGEEKILVNQIEKDFKKYKDFYLKSQPNPKEIYYNNKYPEIIKYYTGRHVKNVGRISLDVRNFFVNPDSDELQKIVKKFKGTDDQKALKSQKWVIKNIKYVSDKKQTGLPEYWFFPFETLKTRKGDCDDGAILMANLMLASGIPYWKIRINAGWVYDHNGDRLGGHAYVVYYSEKHDKWVTLDWCFYPETKPVKNKKEYKDHILYGYGSVWFSFNKKYAFSKSTKYKKSKK